MAQYINKSAVIAKLEKQVKRLEDAFNNPSFASYEANLIAKGGYRKLKDILSFLDTLEVKEVDLEEEMNKWRQKHFEGIGYILDGSGEWLERTSQLDIAKHFYELGLKEQLKNK